VLLLSQFENATSNVYLEIGIGGPTAMRLLIAAALLSVLCNIASADQTFIFEGEVWTIVGIDRPMYNNRMTPGAAKFCPTRRVRMEEVEPDNSNGGPMTKEQKERGDKRYRIICVRQ
jgi:hypothetical protein